LAFNRFTFTLKLDKWKLKSLSLVAIIKEDMMSDKVREKDDVRAVGSSEDKKEFTEPKLEFVEPKLTKQGDATKITGQFFTTFLQ
jgi:hypothetical protein